jgi:hypothetical protein
MSTIDEAAGLFDPITLEEMDSVELLNRIDTKFVFPLEQLHQIMGMIADKYNILEVSGVRLNHYRSLYFDTPDHLLYLAHQRGKMNRNKVRYREYSDSGKTYFEVKFKNNKGRTVKNRIKREEISSSLEGRPKLLLDRYTTLSPENLQPALDVTFTRMTFVDKEKTERVTMDLDLHFSYNGHEKDFSGLVIAELKQDRACGSKLLALMHKLHIRECRVSKYCLGIASLNPDIKQNNFKTKLNLLNKINHGNC